MPGLLLVLTSTNMAARARGLGYHINLKTFNTQHSTKDLRPGRCFGCGLAKTSNKTQYTFLLLLLLMITLLLFPDIQPPEVGYKVKYRFRYLYCFVRVMQYQFLGIYLPMWQFSNMTVWNCVFVTFCDIVTLWQCAIETVSQLDRVTVWQCNIVPMWQCTGLVC